MTKPRTDTIIINEELYSLYCYPLKQYWEKYDNKPSLCSLTSGNVRGYSAQWSIEDKRLYLIDFSGVLEIIYIPRKEYNMHDIFPNQKKVFAEWFTGELSVGVGEYIPQYPIEKYEMLIRVESGHVTDTRMLDRVW